MFDNLIHHLKIIFSEYWYIALFTLLGALIYGFIGGLIGFILIISIYSFYQVNKDKNTSNQKNTSNISIPYIHLVSYYRILTEKHWNDQNSYFIYEKFHNYFSNEKERSLLIEAIKKTPTDLDFIIKSVLANKPSYEYRVKLFNMCAEANTYNNQNLQDFEDSLSHS